MTGQCIYSCVHPLYGGSGTCLGADTCLCDDDHFSSRDAFDNPSCVLRSALLSILLTGAAIDLIFVAVLAFNIRRHWQLPRPARQGRRTAIWQRLTLSALFSTTYQACLFSVASASTRGNRSLLELGILPAYYLLGAPGNLMAAMTALELWIDNLPSQLLDTDSWAIKLKTFAEDHGLILRLAITSAAFTSVLGIAMFFTSRPRRLISTAHYLCICCCVLAVLGIFFVGVHISHVIDRAAGWAEPAGQGFYLDAKKRLWAQVTGLCGIGVAWIVAAVMLEFVDIGRGTPSIPWSITLILASSADTFAVHTSRQKAPSPRRVQVAPAPAPQRGDCGKLQGATVVASALSSPRNNDDTETTARKFPTRSSTFTRTIRTISDVQVGSWSFGVENSYV